MSNPTLPVTYGMVNGSPITGSVNSATLAAKQTVTIGANAYVRAVPPGYPDPNQGTQIQTSLTAFAQTLAPGAVVTLFSDEAAALINAGAAS